MKGYKLTSFFTPLKRMLRVLFLKVLIMRKTKNITIVDNGNELKFKLIALSAMQQQRWIAKAFTTLAESGLLEMDVNSLDLNQIVTAIKAKGLGFIGRLDSDKINDLLIELVSKTAKRMNGAGFTELNERELENTFESIKALIELEKECFNISFDFFQIAE